MNGSIAHPEELQNLLVALIDGEIGSEQHERLSALLREDPEARECYLFQVTLHARLQKRIPHIVASGECCSTKGFVDSSDRGLPIAGPSAASAASPALGFLGSAWQGTVSYFSQVGPLSYLIATFIMLAMGAAAWSWKLPGPMQFVEHTTARPSLPTPDPSSRMQFVGRITGMVDCQWSDPNTAVPGPVAVPLGRRYALSSGLMEITYDSGAKVILQGPCTYEVESASGGYLAVGRLTARVEKGKAVRSTEYGVRRTKAEELSASSSSFLVPHSYFAVRTPTAIVTDLGTEFGVEVEQSGTTETYVLQGHVEARIIGTDGKGDNSVRLGPHESARVQCPQGEKPSIRLATTKGGAFVRRMPRQVALQVFSTGVNVAAGRPDAHWQIVAASNDLAWQPKQALATTAHPAWLANEPSRSQWISLVGDGSHVSNAVQYTFRTNFDLGDVLPDTVRLSGRYAVDNIVRAIRLNGRDVPIPEPLANPMETFTCWQRFTVTRGFIDGVNALEIDVWNDEGVGAPFNPMGLRVELEGFGMAKPNMTIVEP